jgi:hypothetical protein
MDVDGLVGWIELVWLAYLRIVQEKLGTKT